jgi:hypothetical protein
LLVRRPRLIGRVLVGVAFGIAVLALVPGVGSVADGIHDARWLPDRISVCGRDYSRDATNRRWSFAQVTAASPGFPPVVVDPGLLARLFTPCQPGACTRVADGPCATVVWVRVGSDAYIAYELSGGP